MQLKQELLDNPPNCLGPLLGSQQTVHNQSFAVLVCWFVSCSSPVNTGRGGGFVLQACVLGDAEFLSCSSFISVALSWDIWCTSYWLKKGNSIIHVLHAVMWAQKRASELSKVKAGAWVRARSPVAQSLTKWPLLQNCCLTLSKAT